MWSTGEDDVRHNVFRPDCRAESMFYYPAMGTTVVEQVKRDYSERNCSDDDLTSFCAAIL